MARQKARLGRSVAAALTAVLLMAHCELCAHAATFDEMVPEEVTSFVSLRNYRELAGKIENSPYGALLSEPEVKAFVEQIKELLSDATDSFAQFGGIKLADVEGILSGEIAMATITKIQGAAVMGMGMPGQSQQTMLLLVDVGENAAAAEQLLEKILKVAADQGAEITEEEFRGHRIRKVSVSMAPGLDEEQLEGLDLELREMLLAVEGGPAGGAGLFICLEGHVLALSSGTDRSLLERHLVLRDGGDIPSLSSSQLYRRLLGHIERESDYVGYQLFEPVWEDMREAAGAPSMLLPFVPAALVESLGVFNIKAQIGGARLEADGISGRFFLLVPAPRTGLLRAFVPTGRVNVFPPSFVGEDVAVYAGAYFDLPILWEEVKAAIKRFSPDTYEMMMQQINDPEAPIHLERDLVQTLGGHWFLYIPKEVITPNPPKEVNVVLAVETRDSQKLEATLQTLIAMSAMMSPELGDTSVQFMGKTIYQTPPIPLPIEEMAPLSLSLVFLDGKLVLTTSLAMAKRVVRDSQRAESPLMQDAEFRAVLPHMIQRPEAMAFMDQRIVVEWIWGLLNMGLASAEVGVEVSLPGYDTIQKYLSVSVSTAKWSEEGLETSNWTPFPTQ